MKDDTYFWQNFLQHPKGVQDEILKAFDERLKPMTAKQQAKEFEGAPGSVILEYLPTLDAEVQVLIYKNYLPVRDKENATKLLKREAKVKLGMLPKRRFCMG